MTAMTEDEARLKRCCGPHDCGHGGNDGLRYCLASVCMAWRWEQGPYFSDTGRPRGDRRQGSCGLVGSPTP